MVLNDKQRTKLMRDYINNRENAIKLNENTINNKDNESEYLKMVHLEQESNKNRQTYANTLSNLRKTLLYECLYSLFDKSLGCQLENAVNDNIKKNLVENYIQEQGAEKIINSFRGKNYLLSEFYRIINKYSDIMLESKRKKCKSKNEQDSIEVDDSSKDDFFEDINTTDSADEVASLIRNRVSTSVNEFINNNAKDQIELKDIINKAQTDIQNNPNADDSIKESYEYRAKRKIANLNKRNKGIFESMISNIANSSFKDDNLKKVYTENGKIKIDFIVENAEIMYTFLEMLNTTEIQRIDESYIETVLKELKK